MSDQQRLDIPEPPTRPSQGLPRWADIVIAIVGLILVSPILVAATIAIKLSSRGPVIYRQRRVGRDGVIFDLFKLRTMREGADPIGVGTAVTAEDPRVTRVGALLRRFSLDELPNLFNVLRGEMRIVGPRATLPAQVQLYTPRQLRRLELRPGVTGWAQIHGRAGIPWEERIELGGAGSVAVDPYAGSSEDSPLRRAAEREESITRSGGEGD
jgi:lipopolysaccharide/colanic/teichoic acid biosynthesis glycosyltransferase